MEAALREKGYFRRPCRFMTNKINTTFVPFVMSSAGGFGPDRDFPKFVFKTARERGRWIMDSQPHLHSTWAAIYASSCWCRHWPMCLGMAYTATSAEVVGRPIVRDENSNMTTDPSRRLPHPDINANGYGMEPRGGGVGLLGYGYWGVMAAGLGSPSCRRRFMELK
jgi:hypothetical protein